METDHDYWSHNDHHDGPIHDDVALSRSAGTLGAMLDLACVALSIAGMTRAGTARGLGIARHRVRVAHVNLTLAGEGCARIMSHGASDTMLLRMVTGPGRRRTELERDLAARMLGAAARWVRCNTMPEVALEHHAERACTCERDVACSVCCGFGTRRAAGCASPPSLPCSCQVPLPASVQKLWDVFCQCEVAP